MIKQQIKLVRDINRFTVSYRKNLQKSFFSNQKNNPKERLAWILFFGQVREFSEIARFLLSINNKKYVAFPIRTCLEILWRLEEYVNSYDKAGYFEAMEKEEYNVFALGEYPMIVESSYKKTNNWEKSEKSRLNKYKSYKMFCGISHGNSFAARHITNNRELYYSYFLYDMSHIQMAMLDMLYQVARENSNLQKKEEKKFLAFKKTCEKMRDLLLENFR